MSPAVLIAFLIALVVYVGVGIAVGRKTRGIADLLPLARGRHAQVKTPAEFSSSTVATTISLATVIMAFFELGRYLGLWLLWTVLTTSAGLILVRILAQKIWHRMSEYDHRPTLHDFLGTEFNSNVLSYVGAVCTSMGFLGAFAVELMVGSKFFAGLVPEIPAWAVIVALSLVTFFYTAVGGFRAVIITDRIQMYSIWFLLLSLPVFYIYYLFTHGGWAANLAKIPEGVLDFSYREGLISFLLGIFVINVPTFISDMSVWQRIAATQKHETVTTGLWGSVFATAATWGTFALLACFVFMICSPTNKVNPLVSLVNVISTTPGILAPVVLFLTALGLYGAMLSTASTQLIAVSHTLYADVFLRFKNIRGRQRLESKRELNISRAILILAAIVSTILVQVLSSAGFSIADLVFAIYGGQLGLCPLVVAALLMERKRLKKLSGWAVLAISAGFITGWGSAIYGRFSGNTNLVFLAPVCSLVSSLVLLGLGILCNKTTTPNVNWILIRSVIKARRAGLYRFVPATGPTQLVCLKDKCAKCCRTLGTPVVSPAEAEHIRHEALMKDKDAEFIKSQQCVCTLLEEGLCSIYPRRPRGCREYPWYNIRGKLYYDRGCPGVKHDRDERPAVEDVQPFENFFPNTPRLIIWLVKKLCTKR